MTLDHQLLTVSEVADAIRVSRMTVYRLIKSGELEAIQVGRHFRISERQVRDYLKASTVRRGSWPSA